MTTPSIHRDVLEYGATILLVVTIIKIIVLESGLADYVKARSSAGRSERMPAASEDRKDHEGLR
jgi:hypothetical protein